MHRLCRLNPTKAGSVTPLSIPVRRNSYEGNSFGPEDERHLSHTLVLLLHSPYRAKQVERVLRKQAASRDLPTAARGFRAIDIPPLLPLLRRACSTGFIPTPRWARPLSPFVLGHSCSSSRGRCGSSAGKRPSLSSRRARVDVCPNSCWASRRRRCTSNRATTTGRQPSCWTSLAAPCRRLSPPTSPSVRSSTTHSPPTWQGKPTNCSPNHSLANGAIPPLTSPPPPPPPAPSSSKAAPSRSTTAYASHSLSAPPRVQPRKGTTRTPPLPRRTSRPGGDVR
ncbi:hypothetical protein T484DRAFT_2781243 [Baffinella frigidus]|nr:hypothetical protein T484DRAFT_2781243 [Cryptophyta sp. CCMP2293]